MPEVPGGLRKTIRGVEKAMKPDQFLVAFAIVVIAFSVAFVEDARR